MEITREWWELRRPDFEIFVSQLVIQEISAGDPAAAAQRLALVEGLSTLEFSEEAKSLGEDLLQQLALPPKTIVDAYHIAIAVVSGMDYLLIWNCKHIANATFRKRIDALCVSRGVEPTTICTPEELLGV